MKSTKMKFFLILIILTTVISIIHFVFVSSNIEYFRSIYNNDDFQYNLMSFNAVIAGFLFSGIGILLSLISHSSIKRLWDNGYLDNFYYSGEIGIIFNIISLAMAFVTTLKIENIFDNNKYNITIKTYNIFICIWTIIEIISAISGLIFFVYCVKELMYCIKLIRNPSK